MTPLSPRLGTVGVGDQKQMVQDVAQPGWIQPPGRLHQHRVGPRGHVGIDGRELLEPASFQAVQQPPELQHLGGQGGIRQAVQILGGQLLHDRRQPRQPARILRRPRCLNRIYVRVHGRNLSSPHPDTSTNPNMWTTLRAGVPVPGRTAARPAVL